MSRRAEAAAESDLTASIPDRNRIGGVVQFGTSPRRTKAYIEPITQKVTRREFDDTALEEEIPGPAGEAMVNICDDLERFVEQRQQREQRFEAFNRLLGHDLRNRLEVTRSHAERLIGRADSDDAGRLSGDGSETERPGSELRQ